MNLEGIKVAYSSLGCKVNLYESISIINKFLDNKATLVDFNEIADIYIINTCSVTNISDQKSKKMVRRAIKQNPNGVIAVMGCSSQLQFEEYQKIDGISVLIGTKDRDKLYDKIIDALSEKNQYFKYYDYLDFNTYEELKVNRYTDHTRGFIKIQDGCNNFCSYCTIPYARGLIKSRDKDNVITEIKQMINSGIKEIVLSGINTGAYGKDFNNYKLSNLLDDICNEICGDYQFRISSIEATEITNELLDVIKKHKKHFCDHFHIPLQSGCDKTLKNMNRKYDTNYFRNKIALIRSYFPYVNITTDVLTGFNGETIEDYQTTYNFIKEIGFGELHVFPYSKRPMTVAYSDKNTISSAIKKFRVNELIALNNELAINYRNKFLGKKLDVIIEEIKNGKAYGHSSNYIEIEIDNPNIKENSKVEVILSKIDYPVSRGDVNV